MRIEKLSLEEVKIILDSFKAPKFMLANLEIGGTFNLPFEGLTIRKVNGQFIAEIEE